MNNIPWKASLVFLFFILTATTCSAQDCVDNLIKADENGDELLSQNEFGVLLQLESNCMNVDSFLELDQAQNAAYVAAVTAQCLAGGSLDCFLNISNRQLSIAGASSSSTPTTEQTMALDAICTAISVLNQIDCALDDINPTTPPEDEDKSYNIDVRIDQQPCYDGSITARVTDADGNPVVGTDVSFLLTGVADYIGSVTTDQDGIATFLFTADQADDGQALWCSIAVENPITGLSDQAPCQVTVCGQTTDDDVDNEPVCLGNLLRADENNDETLSQDEFSVLLQLEANCSTVDTVLDLDGVQQAAYIAAVTAQCLAEGALSCLLGIGDRTLSIAGAASSFRTEEQTDDLNAVCTAVGLLNIVDCTSLENSNSNQNCSDALERADADDSDTLTRQEFRNFLVDYNQCNQTDDDDSELLLIEEAIFVAVACSSSPEDCLENENSTIDVSPSVLNNSALLSAICLPSEQLECLNEDDEPKELSPECVDFLVQADTNQDTFLSKDEFSVLIQLQSDCEILDSLLGLDMTQEAVYRAAVTTQCLEAEEGLGSLNECLMNSSNRTLSIAGATSTEPTAAETESLAAICDVVDQLRVVECPMLPSGNNVDVAECRAALTSADLDGSNSIGRLEYRFFLKDYNQCEDVVLALNFAEQAVFVSMSCLTGDVTSLQCLLDPASAAIDISDLSSDLIVSTICRTTGQLPCREGLDVPDEVPTGTPEVTQDCVDDLLLVDANADEKLTIDEYLALVVERSDEPVSAPDGCVSVQYDLTSAQDIAFQTLACTSCVTGGESPTCCWESTDTADVSIAGASTDVSQPQGAFLASICTAATAVGGYTVSCQDDTGGGDDDKPSRNGSDPPTASPNKEADCLDDMKSADDNQDGSLDEDEFYELVLIRGAPYCYESGGSLSTTMQVALRIACTASGGFLDCAPGSTKVSMSYAEETIANTACAAIEAEVSSSTCGDGQPTLSPTQLDSSATEPPSDTTSDAVTTTFGAWTAMVVAILSLLH